MTFLHKHWLRRIGYVLFLLMLIPAAMHSDELAERTKAIMEDRQEAVVLTRTVLEMYEKERKIEGLATIIDKDGLAVISLSSIDPASFYSTGSEDVKVKDIKMVLADNTEIPSKVVLRDPELDLAFIKPLEKVEQSLTCITLSEYTTPDILDQVVVLSRLGSAVGNVTSVSLARIQAIIEKPRIMFMPDPFIGLASGMGTPVFALNGDLIGILLMRVTRGSEGYQGDAGGISSLGMLPIVLPAREIIDVMERAPGLEE